MGLKNFLVQNFKLLSAKIKFSEDKSSLIEFSTKTMAMNSEVIKIGTSLNCKTSKKFK